ncbi:hypothetical protein V1460_30425 [Streptomyces sp. SCSIO 30461]|uniref:hypothetical protein n=1 Tax=Streptomyces sp. SCSIO 30461 TaxID=3118085 RepID=UPI0030CC0938
MIARPTDTGYTGIHVQHDGHPSHHLPLLLTAYQYRFERDTEALSQHLIDEVPIAWAEIGTDLLDGAPTALLTALTGGKRWPSRTMDNVITTDGSPPVRMLETEMSVEDSDTEWVYVLHQHGIEVISAPYMSVGAVVDWDTDPRSAFSDHPFHWAPGAVPVITPRTTEQAAPAAAPPAATAAPRAR